MVMRLKLKYRTRAGVYRCGIYRPRTGNSHGQRTSVDINLRPRRHAYGPW